MEWSTFSLQLAFILLVFSVTLTESTWDKKKVTGPRNRFRDDESMGIVRRTSRSEWPDFLATFYYPDQNFARKSSTTFKKKSRRKNRKNKLNRKQKKLQRRINRKIRKNFLQQHNRWLVSAVGRAKGFQIKNRLKSFKSLDGPRLARLRSPPPSTSTTTTTTTPAPSVVEHLTNERRQEASTRRPNVILMMADDQDVELGSLQFMPKLNRFLRAGGAHMENGYVTTPMCCPSRSSMLTGLYAHNHNVLTNKENCSSPEWIREHEPHTFATYMRDAGYRTGYFGKYLNRYDGGRIPDGWDEWSGLIRNSKFYNYTLNVNGEKVAHGNDYAKDYFPDLITNDSLAFFRNSKLDRPDQPVMMVMSYPGPHGPEDSAPQYQDLFFNVTTHHTPAYDYAPNPDKQWILQVTERMDVVQRKFTDVLMTKRLQTLQSIDEAIERLCNQLAAIGELENTYVFYTSDHGYHLGQFGLVKGKAFPFEVDTKVPFFVRGPGIVPSTVRLEPVLNIDLAPTFLDIAGVPTPPHMDGRSVLPTLLKENMLSEKEREAKSGWRDSFLMERGKMTSVRYEKIKDSIRGGGMGSALSNATRSGASDGKTDNHIYRPLAPPFATDVTADLLLLEKPRLTKQERLASECLKPRFQAPCAPFQQRKCVRKKNGDWRMVSCNKQASDTGIATPESNPNEEECSCDEELSVPPTPRSERKLQREFLKKHTSRRQQRKLRHRFLEDAYAAATALGLDYDEADYLWHRFKRSPSRWKRETGEEVVSEEVEELEVSSNVTAVLEEIAKEEIDEVDIIMEDINEEIQDLEQSIVVVQKPNNSSQVAPISSTMAPSSGVFEDASAEHGKDHANSSGCRVATSASEVGAGSAGSLSANLEPIAGTSYSVNCSADVYETPSRLEKSKAYVNEQIRRLRSQLFELKEIRKHLQRKQPKLPRQSKTSSTRGSGNSKHSMSSCSCGNRSSHRATRKQDHQREVRRQRERQRRERKERRQAMKKAKKLRKERRKLKRNKGVECPVNDSFMNCFTHNNDHWKTKPLWRDGSFCACTNSNTNTYSCVRTINATHNYLYCEFVSGIITYYDLNVDPYQLRNIYQTLSDGELNYMHAQLLGLKEYSGIDGKWKSRIGGSGRHFPEPSVGRSRQQQKRLSANQLRRSLSTTTGAASGSRRQRKFKSRKSRRRHNSTRKHRNYRQKNLPPAWISMLISFKL